jgi:hypothetical protein
MTWRVRGTDDEISILRGLVDELSIMVEIEFANEHHDKSLIEFNEAVQKTIWMANNQSDENGEPIWWPKHEEIDGDVCLIEETLDENQNRIEKRVSVLYNRERIQEIGRENRKGREGEN